MQKKDGSYEVYKTKPGFVLAGMEGIRYRQGSIQLEPGDRLFLYTDGVPEATNGSQEMFGTDRMLQALNTETKADSREILSNVKQAVETFVGEAPQFDDLTMLAIRLR